jgi:hypothetical protein
MRDAVAIAVGAVVLAYGLVWLLAYLQRDGRDF